jgi:hypothetical protein
LIKKTLAKLGGFCEATVVSRKGTHKNNLYYLMPGMGRGARKRFWRNLAIGLLVGLALSGLMWWLFSYLNS